MNDEYIVNINHQITCNRGVEVCVNVELIKGEVVRMSLITKEYLKRWKLG